MATAAEGVDSSMDWSSCGGIRRGCHQQQRRRHRSALEKVAEWNPAQPCSSSVGFNLGSGRRGRPARIGEGEGRWIPHTSRSGLQRSESSLQKMRVSTSTDLRQICFLYFDIFGAPQICLSMARSATIRINGAGAEDGESSSETLDGFPPVPYVGNPLEKKMNSGSKSSCPSSLRDQTTPSSRASEGQKGSGSTRTPEPSEVGVKGVAGIGAGRDLEGEKRCG